MSTTGTGIRASHPSYPELHCHSAFSFRSAGSSVEALVARAAALGMNALALTDTMTLAGVVRFQAACAQQGLRGIVGVELAVADPVFGDTAAPASLVALAQDAAGYARLCELLTEANLAAPESPVVPFSALAAQPEDLIFLSGGRNGMLARLLLAGRCQTAEEVAQRYRDAFGPDRFFVELQHHRLPDSVGLMQRLVWIAQAVGLRCVATNGVRYATRDDYPIYDTLTCTRLGITVDQPHYDRPRNDEAFLRSASEMEALFTPLPWGVDALAATREIAARCGFDRSLLKTVCTAPRVSLPNGVTSPDAHLRTLCEAGLSRRYTDHLPAALAPQSPQRRQLEHELTVIGELELADFFLVVADIVRQARQMGIRVSGRGSAANSLVAYLLGITGVDPIEHGLLFERFLNPERRGMPDVDLDVQSDRREELIRYVERTYSREHAAMVANVITYRPRSALRDTAKALGYPLPLVNALTKVLPHHCAPDELPTYAAELAQVITTAARSQLADRPRDSAAGSDRIAGIRSTDSTQADAIRTRCLKRLPLLLELAARIVGLPRHLSLHNGGIVLTREPLSRLLPVRLSANGVRALEVDKDDAERMGLIKFDLLGLRTQSAVAEALDLIEETTGTRPDVDHLPVDPPDPTSMRLVRKGQTLAVFQLESPGQWHLLSQTQPHTFDDIIIQTALFRPGPLQGGFVRPYVERRQAQQAQQAQERHQPRQALQRQQVEQRDAVQTPWRKGQPVDTFWTDHPVLGRILRDTEGISLFQEQVLLIANQYAGLSLAEADGFRRAMSHVRSPREMESMGARFLQGAVARGEPVEEAQRVFAAISAYTGYGFCKSHAAEFARLIYITAWLKAHYSAHYLAAFLSVQPAGFFPAHVVLEEAKRLGVPVLNVDINRSEDRFTVEAVGTRERTWAIRIGLRQVAHVGDELAETILWERRHGHGQQPHARPYRSLSDFCLRLRPAGLDWAAAESLVLAGAFDSMPPRLERRRLLWHLHEVWPLTGPTRTRTRRRQRRRAAEDGEEAGDAELPEQMAFTWQIPSEALDDVPSLPALDQQERAALDYALLGMSACPHPMRLRRRDLRRRGIRAIAELGELPAGRGVRVAGWCISAQKPPTAKGMAFLVLEDETGRLPVALPPRLAEQLHRAIRSAHAVVVAGRLERSRWYRSVLAVDLRAME